MTHFARLDSAGLVIETAASDPSELFHEELAAQFIAVPDHVETGWKQDGQAWLEPEPQLQPEMPPAPKQQLSKAAFLDALTRDERLLIRGARTTDPIADDFLLMLDATGIADLTSADGQAALSHFVGQGYLTAARSDELLALVG